MKRLFKVLLIVSTVIVVFIMASVDTSAAAKKTVTVLIDPGHGGPATVATNLGACYGGLQEKDITLLTAAALKSELEKYGNVKVFMSRNMDVEIGLKERIDMAKAVGADAVVSVHFNASTRHLMYGSEIFVPCGPLYSQGASLGKSIMKQWTTAGMIDKGVKTRIGKSGDYYGLIRHGASANIPTIILEHGYLDNPHDVTKVDDALDWAKLAALDAQGIANYFGLKKGVTKATVAPIITTSASKVVVDDLTPPALAIKINSYNIATGEVNYTLTGLEPESRLYLYGVSTGVTFDEAGKVVPDATDLTLWGKGNTVTGKIMVPPGYVGPINAYVFNNFNLSSNMATAYVGM
ncbi:MAG: N-acetylmuramoyl-L-alanine amidase [Lachnospiraceae bacterium]|nr:N-acetylmuramoyl-L-alanine amidase [Lachnospiraceae bacterium]